MARTVTHSDESGVVAAIVRAVLRTHPSAWVLKTSGGPWQVPGVPDLLVCVGGRFVALEVKHRKPGESAVHARGRASVQQLDHIRRIRSAGGAAAVVLSVPEALALASGEWVDHS